MNFRESKIELWIGVLVAVMVVGMFKLLGGSDVQTTIHIQDVSYEMPRPKGEVIGEFGLGDREIDRQYVNPFEKKQAAEAARKEAMLKKAAILAKPAQGVAAGSGIQQFARRPMVLVNYVDANNKGLSGDKNQPNPQKPPEEQSSPPVRTAAGENDDKKDDKLSPDQWRALMSAQPTKENMKKLTEAYAKHELDDKTFYGIIEEFLKSTNAEKQAVGFYGLGLVPTTKSFALVANIESSFTTEAEKTQASSYLNNFASSSKQAALLGAVQSSDKDVSLRAAQVVLNGLKNGPPASPVRDNSGRNQASTLATASGWSRFKSIFERWASSGDPALTGFAHDILPLLTTTSA